jgi:predicted amidohydrolase YtcJ
VSEETVSGRIKPGYRADLTGFAADPVATDADALLDLPILMTIVDGRVVHEAR